MPEHALNHPFARIVNPPLARLLRQLEMDKRFVRGEGCELIDADGEHYLDAVAAHCRLATTLRRSGRHYATCNNARSQYLSSRHTWMQQVSSPLDSSSLRHLDSRV